MGCLGLHQLSALLQAPHSPRHTQTAPMSWCPGAAPAKGTSCAHGTRGGRAQGAKRGPRGKGGGRAAEPWALGLTCSSSSPGRAGCTPTGSQPCGRRACPARHAQGRSSGGDGRTAVAGQWTTRRAAAPKTGMRTCSLSVWFCPGCTNLSHSDSIMAVMAAEKKLACGRGSSHSECER